MDQFDVIIIGAGIAGASLAHFIGRSARVLIIEGEAYAGYHTTGRSAAFYAETYGGPLVQPLTTASRAFFDHPPAGFAGFPLLRPRGALYVAQKYQRDLVTALQAKYQRLSLEIVDSEFIQRRAPMLHSDWRACALWEADCQDIDTAAVHQGFLASSRRQGALMTLGQPVQKISRSSGGWEVYVGKQAYKASVLVNAAGAWVDEVAVMSGVAPLGFMPLRRTLVSFHVPDADYVPDAPLILGIDETFYFKPDAGMIWASPHDETPSAPCDVQPEEMDIAITVDRMEQATTYKVQKIEKAWAGLRTFAPDRLPVFGFDPSEPGLFWCAGQGGFGMQTAPAAGELCASLILGKPVPEHLLERGIDLKAYQPNRFR